MKGSDYLGDQDAIETMCDEAVDVIVELEHMGLPFSRTPDGKIAQRPFGGHTHHFGQGPVRRSCYAADRTGHMILQTLYQNCVKNGVDFFDEYQVVDLLIDEGRCAGVVAYEVATGDLHVFRAKAVNFATGGFGRVWSITSNAFANTGDGPAVALRRGIPLEDMEFFQFHPTGHLQDGHPHHRGRARRGRGAAQRPGRALHGALRAHHEGPRLARRGLARHLPEIREGRGINGKQYVYLDATHLGAEVIEKKLPDIADFCRTYLGVDPVKEPMPIQPTAHYAMGGIPTDVDGRVILDDQQHRRCPASTPPARRPASRCTAPTAWAPTRCWTWWSSAAAPGSTWPASAWRPTCGPLPETPTAEHRGAASSGSSPTTEGEPAARLREEMQDVMMDDVGVFRTGEGMQEAVDKVARAEGALPRTWW